MNKKRGFTLVELLVVIAVIALLLSILMPVLRKAKDGAMRILCGNHIKNVMLGMMMYADTHSNKIPYTSANWPWDCEKIMVTELLKNMGTDMSGFLHASENTAANDVTIQFSTNFYCPANARKKRYRESEWNYSDSYRVLGYAFMWKSTWNVDPTSSSGKILGPDGINADPSKKWVDRTDMPQASAAELVMDATLSDQAANPINYPKGNFGVIITGGNPAGVPDCSNHLVTDAKVAGGNIGFVDGHVEWRPFTEMIHRINRGTSTGGGQIWWWW